MEVTNQLTVETVINAPLEKIWELWTEPRHIQQWNAASPDWHCPSATNDLRAGGKFLYRMEAKDKSVGFDFDGTYAEVSPQSRIAYALADGRKVVVSFTKTAPARVKVSETLEMEKINPAEMQRLGWQAILNAFRTYVESGK